MSDINVRKRRQAMRKRFEHALARRVQVDGLHDQAITLELARLRAIEEEAFRLVGESPDLLTLPPDFAGYLTRLEHALLVEAAAVPTLKPAPDLIALLEDDETFGEIAEELQAKQGRLRG